MTSLQNFSSVIAYILEAIINYDREIKNGMLPPYYAVCDGAKCAIVPSARQFINAGDERVY
jgi:hypothetical protein